MILTDKHLIELLKTPFNKDNLLRGASLQDDHKIHVTGEGYESKVSQVEGYESNKDYLNIKKQLGKPATIQITSTVIDNLNRWNSAQGTVKVTDFKDDEKNKAFQDVLNQVWNGKSFEDFINAFYKEAIFIEFNGFVLVTKPVLNNNMINREGIEKPYEGGALDPYMIFLSIEQIHDYRLTGDKVEYLIIKLDTEGKKFRVVDDARDMVLTLDNNKLRDIVEIPNIIGYVPARMISNINENILNHQVKTSPINHIIPSLDRYFSCDYDLRMQIIKHAYPKLAIVTRECKACNSLGYWMDQETKVRCNTCEGTGREIPIARDGVIGIPEFLMTGDQPYPGSPASYINPEVESLRICIEDLKQQKLDIIYAGTGDKNIVAESMNTATENIINTRSLEDRIAEISKMVEEFETFVKTAIKDMHTDFFPIKDYNIHIKYGKKIAIRNETELLKEIEMAKKDGLNFTYIKNLQTEIIYIRYKNNNTELERQLILNDLEPFVGYTTDELLKFEKYVKKEDLKLKVNFNSLINELESTTPIETIGVGRSYKEKVEMIKQLLYALIPEDEQEEVQEVQEPIEEVEEPIV